MKSAALGPCAGRKETSSALVFFMVEFRNGWKKGGCDLRFLGAFVGISHRGPMLDLGTSNYPLIFWWFWWMFFEHRKCWTKHTNNSIPFVCAASISLFWSDGMDLTICCPWNSPTTVDMFNACGTKINLKELSAADFLVMNYTPTKQYGTIWHPRGGWDSHLFFPMSCFLGMSSEGADIIEKSYMGPGILILKIMFLDVYNVLYCMQVNL